jgi:hypothetical protein
VSATTACFDAVYGAPGGRLYLHERHPLGWALTGAGVRFAHTYFEEPDPHVDESGETDTTPTSSVRSSTPGTTSGTTAWARV